MSRLYHSGTPDRNEKTVAMSSPFFSIPAAKEMFQEIVADKNG
jgi:hypothetical protein